MAPTATVTAPTPEVHEPGPVASDLEALVLEDVLVEEVSIDGMCGVY